MVTVDDTMGGMADAAKPPLPLDMRLLVSLEALLTERHVTRAARRLGVTQSTLSHALSQLRAQLGDPLLVRAGKGLSLTPRAEALATPLARLLRELRALVSEAAPFDPATTHRTFSLLCPDLLAPLLPRLLAALDRQAPWHQLEVAAPSTELSASLAAGPHELALTPAPGEAPGLVQRPIGALRWCVLARRGHPALGRGNTLSKQAWLSYPHIVVRTGNATPNRVAGEVAKAGLSRRVKVTVPSFLMAPFVVAETDCFFAAARELIEPLADRLSLAVCDAPIAMAPVPVVACWHERMHADEGHRWFRGVVIDELRAALARPPTGHGGRERRRPAR